MDEVDFGDLCFSLFVSYIGALEFLMILRHLVHWSGRHASDDEDDAQNLQRLKEKLRQQLEAAKEREQQANAKVMQDGVAYKDGFRIDPHQKEIDELKAEILNIEARMRRRAEMEAELVRQRKIRDETKKQLERAEAELALKREKAAAEEEEKRKQQAISEEAENLRRLLAAEKQREAEQKQREEEEAENLRKILAAEKQREEEQRRMEEIAEAERQRQQSIANEEAENVRKLLEAERQREAEQAKQERERAEAEEAEESAQNILAAERQYEEEQRNLENFEAEDQKQGSSLSRKLIEAEKLRQSQEEEDSEDYDDSGEAFQPLQRKERKQKLIAENARKFLEAEQEMVQKMLESTQQAEPPMAAVVEEPFIKRTQAHIASARPPSSSEQQHNLTTTVKTQFGQGSNESFTLSTKPLLFPGVSDDASSNEPNSSKQSSFSTQPSDEIMTGTEDFNRTATLSLQMSQQERQDPDGEDNNTPTLQYDEEYLRSLDGIKHRPLIREDGSGRRRAFKKRRSSGSSNSSRDSRTSREEELKMFTSLEEEELNSSHSGEPDFTPIKYTSEPTLKVKSHHHRRHKRSPAKDARLPPEDNLRTSLEMLGEESTNPWGEVVPEHYKNTEFWRREKAMSIDEEEIELEVPTTGQEAATAAAEAETENANNKISSSSFEEATHEQNEQAMSAMSQPPKEADTEAGDPQVEDAASAVDSSSKPNDSERSNLQSSHESERSASPARSSASPRLRRSPRIEEMDHYEERWKESEITAEQASINQTQPKTPTTPKINIQPAGDNGPWRDEYGLIMQGLSDFYDFQASVNPSRSRDNSRNPSPANSQPSSPLPKDVSYDFNQLHDMPNSTTPTTVFDIYDDSGDGFDFGNAYTLLQFDVYDDTGNCQNIEIEPKNIDVLIETLHEDQFIQSNNTLEACNDVFTNARYKVQTVADEAAAQVQSSVKCVPAICIEHTDTEAAIELENNVTDREEMNAFVQSLRNERIRSSRSRSRSPLPSTMNLERSLEARRTKLIKHNEEIFEKLTKSNSELEISAAKEIDQTENISSYDHDAKEEMNQLIESLRVDRKRSRSRSPLPTMNNFEKSLETRRTKLIEHNDKLFEQLADSKDNKKLSRWIDDATVAVVDNESKHEMNELVESLRLERRRSRSRSPLPTMDNIERSLETRRSKLIQHNDDVAEKLKVDVEESKQTAAKEEMNALVDSLRLAQKRSRSRSRSPLPTMENVQRSLETRRTKLIQHNDEISEKLLNKDDATQNNELTESRKEMNELVASMRLDRSRSRSRSPLPTMDNVERSLEMRRNKLIQHNDELFDKLTEKTDLKFDSPSIKVESVEEVVTKNNDAVGFADKEMCALVASLRAARSRSRSTSPMPMSMRNNYDKPQNEATHQRAESPSNPPQIIVEYLYQKENNELTTTKFDERYKRSRTPSRSQSPPDDEDFHRLLNLESSQNRTLAKESEELESILAEKQRHLDNEALFKLKTAQEETELRTMSPIDCLENSTNGELEEANDQLADLPVAERLRKLRCTPTTPDYERSLSEECKDVQRIKNEMLSSGFKRSTYVGESMELGSEYENLRRETANFRRSKRPSPSFSEEQSTVVGDNANLNAAAKRRIQETILKELVTSSSEVTKNHDENRNGAKPKAERRYSMNDSFVGDSSSSSVVTSEQVEDLRREMATFQRSRSCSRSPMDERATREVAAIEAEAIKREMQDRILDNLSNNATLSFQNFQDFSRHLNADFLDDRRASDSAMMVQFRDSDSAFDIEPEEYHHYRRFSLNQEQPVEEYPDDDDDYIYVSEVEIQTSTGTRTWLREDFYSGSFDSLQKALANDEQQHGMAVESVNNLREGYEFMHHEEDDTDGSEDERQTVVEVDDEIDTDICDFNERGPTDESHHEQSECEEAERAMDHYAGREAADWQEVSDVGEIFRNNETRSDEEGAVGGNAIDSDSFTIDQIYDDAIKNRKQSGILREFDSILLEMQKSYERNTSLREDLTDQERYALWAKTRALERGEGSGGGRKKSLTVSFLEAEKRDTEMRYLGDANMTARQSTRLRSRYGYVPKLQNSTAEDLDVDLNYKPKREYNWRKNFKLDEDSEQWNNEAALEADYVSNYVHKNGEYYEVGSGDGEGNGDGYDHDDFDERKFSLGGESITLFSRSPDREVSYVELAENEPSVAIDEIAEHKENNDLAAPKKTKKKKSKKKTLRGSKEQLERQLSKDEDDSDSQNCSRRSSSIQMETDSPKRKSRSRRSSRSSVTTNDDTNSLFSPRSSVGFVDGLLVEGGTMETNEPAKKKIKKRKKVKENFSKSNDIKEEMEQPEPITLAAPPPTVSASLTPESASVNMLAALSPQHSVCVTPASTESEKSLKSCHLNEAKTSSTTTTTKPSIASTITTTTTSTITTSNSTRSSSALESFDLLKDANFYPLF